MLKCCLSFDYFNCFSINKSKILYSLNKWLIEKRGKIFQLITKHTTLNANVFLLEPRVPANNYFIALINSSSLACWVRLNSNWIFLPSLRSEFKILSWNYLDEAPVIDPGWGLIYLIWNNKSILQYYIRKLLFNEPDKPLFIAFFARYNFI